MLVCFHPYCNAQISVLLLIALNSNFILMKLKVTLETDYAARRCYENLRRREMWLLESTHTFKICFHGLGPETYSAFWKINFLFFGSLKRKERRVGYWVCISLFTLKILRLLSLTYYFDRLEKTLPRDEMWED